MAMGSYSGHKVTTIKENGSKTSVMALVASSTQTEMPTKGIGKTITSKETVNITTPTAASIMETGSRTKNMAWEQRPLQVTVSTKEATIKARDKEKVRKSTYP